jgi:hypothetical protein
LFVGSRPGCRVESRTPPRGHLVVRRNDGVQTIMRRLITSVVCRGCPAKTGPTRLDGLCRWRGRREPSVVFFRPRPFLFMKGRLHGPGHPLAGRVEGATRAIGGIFSPPPLPFYEGEAPRALPVEGATRAPNNCTRGWNRAPLYGTKKHPRRGPAFRVTVSPLAGGSCMILPAPMLRAHMPLWKEAP